jgi:hypothetical protein
VSTVDGRAYRHVPRATHDHQDISADQCRHEIGALADCSSPGMPCTP